MTVRVVQKLRLTGAFLILLMMTACHSTSVPKANLGQGSWLRDPAFFAAAMAEHTQLKGWRYSAKVGLVTPQVQENANIVWQFADQANQVRLFGPLGTGTVKIDFDRYGVQLSDSRGLLHRGDNAEELLARVTGWPIPLDALSYWLFALPLPGHPMAYQLDDTGRVTRLRQLGWEIAYFGYKHYQKDSKPQARKLLASKQLDSGQAVIVKLITKSWQ